jgi:hypothetical protein
MLGNPHVLLLLPLLLGSRIVCKVAAGSSASRS